MMRLFFAKPNFFRRLFMLGETATGTRLRYPIMTSAWSLVLVLFGYTLDSIHLSAEEIQRPNIVFIIADDLGWADVGFHDGNVPTPNLDRLASENLELNQHYVAPVCSPTRSALMTGRCWSRFGVTTPTNSLALPFDTVTLPRALKSCGYDTCLIGKWHLGSLPKWGPNHFGFDHSYGSLAGGISPWNHRYKKGPYTYTWHRNEELISEKGHVTDLLTDEAVRWIGERSQNPFLLYMPYTAVHLPVKEPKAWLEKVPTSIQGDVPRHYAASIMHLDDSVGQIIQALQNKGIRENTLVVFTSDNGGSTAENNDLKYPDDNCPNGRLPGNNYPLRGQKGEVYEGGIRVPTIVSWPGSIASGCCETPVQITDWMPTFCRLAGFTTKQSLQWDGADLTSMLVDGKSLPERSIYIAGVRWRSSALVFGNWKLVVRKQGDQQATELYDLASDLSETIDRSKDEPAVAKKMLERLAEAASEDNTAVAQSK